ncbi:MAG: class I SAM-dependent methyltransferase [Jaaginema sp. PMC 1079.18]|nr:class I SAM-dependent methyltransferase [Jaaginema sp. PMC 1080.18]MEC4850331.1 class I SAM-dependent methyltransferase [Jaaginema sp. PMC 1079.18]MEC4865584.1 class I SAM-dependent methyltransferase [Jaaginema sp. PMC 1078.18]
MATILRDWSYRYQWLYDGISGASALAVGGEARFRQLALQGLDFAPQTAILDLCCGAGQTTRYLVEKSDRVTGLDASPFAVQRAKRNVPQASYVEAFAENQPFPDGTFDLVHTSVALHEMKPQQLQAICQEVYRVLRPGGIFAFIDFHKPHNPIFWPGLAMFLWLFETETAWQLLETDLLALLQDSGFQERDRRLYVGGSLQVIQVQK